MTTHPRQDPRQDPRYARDPRQDPRHQGRHQGKTPRQPPFRATFKKMRDADFRAIHGALTNRGAVRRVAERYAGYLGPSLLPPPSCCLPFALCSCLPIPHHDGSVSYDTLLSIYALKYQQHAIASMEGHKAKTTTYYRQYGRPSLSRARARARLRR